MIAHLMGVPVEEAFLRLAPAGVALMTARRSPAGRHQGTSSAAEETTRRPACSMMRALVPAFHAPRGSRSSAVSPASPRLRTTSKRSVRSTITSIVGSSWSSATTKSVGTARTLSYSPG